VGQVDPLRIGARDRPPRTTGLVRDVDTDPEVFRLPTRPEVEDALDEPVVRVELMAARPEVVVEVEVDVCALRVRPVARLTGFATARAEYEAQAERRDRHAPHGSHSAGREVWRKAWRGA